MWKLIGSELRKLLTNTFNLTLLIFVIGFMVFNIVRGYHAPANSFLNDGDTFATFEGEPLHSLSDFYAYADEVLRSYEGAVSEELWQRYKEDYNTLRAQMTAPDNIDTDRMERIYGEDWEGLIARNEAGTLTSDDRQLLEELFVTSEYVSMDPVFLEEGAVNDPSTSDHYLLQVFYQEESALRTLNAIYRGNPYIETTEAAVLDDATAGASPYHYPLYQLLHPNAYRSFLQNTLSYSQTGMSTETTNLSLFAEERLAQTAVFGSPISATVLFNNLRTVSILTLIVLAIVCANSFAMEKSTGMDQLIIPTTITYVRITVAKIIANVLVGCLLYALQLLIAVGLTAWILPLHGLDIPAVAVTDLLWMYDMPYLTFRELITSMMMLQLLGVLVLSMLVSVLSCFTKSRFLTIILLFALLLVPFAFYRQIPLVLSLLCPSNYMNTLYLFLSSDFLLDPILDNGWWIKDALWIVWAILAGIATAAMLRQARLHRVSTR